MKQYSATATVNVMEAAIKIHRQLLSDFKIIRKNRGTAAEYRLFDQLVFDRLLLFLDGPDDASSKPT